MRQLNHFGFSLMVVARMLRDTEQTVRKNYADYDDSIAITFNKEMERFLKKQKEKGEDYVWILAIILFAMIIYAFNDIIKAK